MAERHAFGLEALAEMTGKLLQAAYMRANRPGDGDDRDRAILLFDRLARGFRLTLSLEARLDRDRRSEAAKTAAADAAAPELRPPEPPSPELPSPAAGPRRLRPPREADHEQDVDLEPSDLPGHVRDLRRMIAEDGDIIDPDGTAAQALDRWAGAWGDVLNASPDRGDSRSAPPQAPSPAPSPEPRRPWRASG